MELLFDVGTAAATLGVSHWHRHEHQLAAIQANAPRKFLILRDSKCLVEVVTVADAKLLEHGSQVGNITARSYPSAAVNHYRVGITLSESSRAQERVLFVIGAASAGGTIHLDGGRKRMQPVRRRQTVVIQERQQLGAAAFDATIARPCTTAARAVRDNE